MRGQAETRHLPAGFQFPDVRITTQVPNQLNPVSERIHTFKFETNMQCANANSRRLIAYFKKNYKPQTKCGLVLIAATSL